MQNLLLIDTTSPTAQVGLKVGATFFQRSIEGSINHTERLLPLIHEIFEEAKLPHQAIDAVVVTKGPGGFAGVRVGFCVGQALAYGWNKPFIPLSTLEVLAYTAYFNNPSSQPYLVLMDAKMGEVYSGLYEFNRNKLILLSEETLLPLSALQEHIAALKIDNLNLYSNIDSDTMLNNSESDYFLSLEAMAECAANAAAISPMSATPSYIRNQVTHQAK